MAKLIFGPVNSRRLGRSLGIDIVPKKCCNLNCIYCEVGPTTIFGRDRQDYTSWEDLKEEFSDALKNKEFDVITITGMGEPTLNRNLKNIVQNIKSLTNKPLVLLTNSLLLIRKEVREDILDFTVISPSLDAVLEADFQRIDRPVISITPEKIIRGLVELRKEFKGKIWLEVLFVHGYNDSPEAIEALREAVLQIQPDKVHLNSVGRPPLTAMKEKFAEQVQSISQERLEEIRQILGPSAEIISPKKKTIHQTTPVDYLSENIMEYLKRRPTGVNEIAEGLNVAVDQVSDMLIELYQKQKIQKKFHENHVVYYTNI